MIGLEKYFIRQQIDLSKRDALANVLNRGVAGIGEKTRITGLRAPANPAKSVLWPTFRPGASTVIFYPANGSTGIGLVELFEY